MKLRQAFSQAVREWDKKIRLVGKTPVETLYDESLEALQSRPPGMNKDCLVDIGAGNGIVGFPWLELSPGHKAIFLEPDIKKAAFLLEFISKAPEVFQLRQRCRVLPVKLEDVPRETILTFAGESYCLVTRAFSGARTLRDAFDLSSLKKEDLFVFDLVNGRGCFRKLDITC